MLAKLKLVKWGYFLFALLITGVGVCFLLWNESLNTIALAFGILLTLFATVFCVLTLAERSRGGAFFLRMTFGLLALIGGIVSLILHKQTIDIIVMVIGFLLIIDGSFKLQTTVLAKRYHSPFWWIMLILSVTVIVGGACLSKIVFEEVATQAVLNGLVMIVDGIGNFLSLFFIPYVERCARKEASAAAVTAPSGENT